jgi:hypothetical protein
MTGEEFVNLPEEEQHRVLDALGAPRRRTASVSLEREVLEAVEEVRRGTTLH